MNRRDDFILSICLPTSAVSLAAEQAAAPRAPSEGAAAVPLCVFLFCERPAVRDDLCETCWEKTQDIRAEWESLSAEFEDGWK